MSFIAPTPPSPPHTLSRSSSAHLSRHSSSASLPRQTFTLSCPNLADHFDYRPTSPNSRPLSPTQPVPQSQTPAPQTQSLISSGASQCLAGLESLDLWNHHIVVPTSASEEREGTPCSNTSCAPTERESSREPSPWPTEGFDFSTPVYIPPMPKFHFPFAHQHATAEELSTILEHQAERPDVPPRPLTPPLSPRSYALSVGLKEIDFAYVDFPGKAEHMAALAAKKAARQLEAASKPRLMAREPIPLASLYPERYGRVLMPPPPPQPEQLPSPSPITAPSPQLPPPSTLDNSTDEAARGPSAAGPSTSALARQKSLVSETPGPSAAGPSRSALTRQPSLAINGPSNAASTRSTLTRQPSLVVGNRGPSAAGPSSSALSRQKSIVVGGSGPSTAGSSRSALTRQPSMVMENRGPSAAGPSRLGLTRQASVILENPIKSAAHSSDVKGKVRPSKILNEKPKSRADVLCFGTPSRSPSPPEESSKRKRDGAEILDEKAKPATNVQRTRSSVKQAGMPTPAPSTDSSRPNKKRKLSDES